MQVKATAPGAAPSLSIECRPGDFEVTGPVAVQVAPVVSLTAEELVTALLLSEVETDALAVMDDADVRHEVAFVLVADGLSAIQETVIHERNIVHRDAAAVRHLELCRARIASAFGLAASKPAAVKRSRLGDALGNQRRIVARAA